MPYPISRRTFGQLLGASTAALSIPGIKAEASVAQAASSSTHSSERRFPKDFLWGSSTASYQVEGAVHEDGRGPSIWDTFSHQQGKVDHGDTGDVGDDFYHRYKSDVALMKGMGLKTFRFSVAWPRLFPTGTGQANPKGLDFYQRLTDALLEAGIEPYCTLYHWDLPQALQDKGGWENRDTAKAFADYAGYFAGKFSGRIRHYMTLNEMRTFVEHGYGVGNHAPGLKVGAKRLAQLTHHVVLGHGLGVQAIRANAKAGTEVGIADNLALTIPAIETPENIRAAQKALREENAMFLTVIMEGKYTEQYLQRLGTNAPKFSAEDLKIISTPMDFLGLNVYDSKYVLSDGSRQGYKLLSNPASYPHMLSPWLSFGPEGLYWAPKLTTELWKPKSIYITENGTSSADTVAPDGHIYDTDRIMFLRSYLTQLQRSIADGCPVKGYFLWSLLDNFEWADGYEKRFGIVYVDFKTQQRIPKLSAEFYKHIVATGVIT